MKLIYVSVCDPINRPADDCDSHQTCNMDRLLTRRQPNDCKYQAQTVYSRVLTNSFDGIGVACLNRGYWIDKT
jgi:hypothetical protein